MMYKWTCNINYPWSDNQTWGICSYLHGVLFIFRVTIKKEVGNEKMGRGKKCYSLYSRVYVREKKGEKASTRDTYLWKCSFESSTFKWDGFQLQAGKFFLGWMEKAGHCLDNGWLDFSLQKYCNISGHTNPFLPFLPCFNRFPGLCLRFKGRWKFGKNRLSVVAHC